MSVIETFCNISVKYNNLSTALQTRMIRFDYCICYYYCNDTSLVGTS